MRSQFRGRQLIRGYGLARHFYALLIAAVLPLSLLVPAQADNRAAISIHTGDASHTSYALIQPNLPMVFVGDFDELKDAKSYRSPGNGAYLWIRADGRDYLLSDQAKLAELQALWQAVAPFEREMAVLQEKMDQHEDEMQAIEDLADDAVSASGRINQAKMAELQQRSEVLQEQIEPITDRMEVIGDDIETLSEQANSQTLAVIDAAIKDGSAVSLNPKK